MMRKLNFITGNKSKFMEAKLILGNRAKLILKDIQIVEPRSTKQEEVVLEKARQAFQQLKAPVLVDDTGIYFEAYKDFPGTATKLVFQAIGFKGIARLLHGSKRGAYFKTLLCYKDSTTTKIFEGVWRGRITNKLSRKFNPDWEYNSIFIPEDFSTPLAEIPLEVRAKISHRKKALDKLVRFLK